jgi:uncharacterized membrane protein YeaQ/YmgE (transglycosylase-associated protein family)
MTSKHQKRVGHRYIFIVAGEYVPVVQVVSWLLILLAMPVGALLFVLPGVGFPLPVVLGMAAAAVAATIAQGWLVERDNPLRSLAIRSAIGAIALLAEYGFIWAIV